MSPVRHDSGVAGLSSMALRRQADETASEWQFEPEQTDVVSFLNVPKYHSHFALNLPCVLSLVFALRSD
jgi:hypothetical protein